MKKIILLLSFFLFATCCTVKIQEGESEQGFLIRACMESAKKSGNFSACELLIAQYVKEKDDERLYKRYDYCKTQKDDSQKFTECWLSLNQK